MNRAHAIANGGTWKFEDRRFRSGDDLYAETTQRRTQVAFITNCEMRNDGSIATKPTPDADGLFIGSVDSGAHRGVARIG